jgi:hypothetical protein
LLTKNFFLTAYVFSGVSTAESNLESSPTPSLPDREYYGEWISPTGYNDPYDDWRDEPYAYDGFTGTKARSNPYYNQFFGSGQNILNLPLTIPLKQICFDFSPGGMLITAFQ